MFKSTHIILTSTIVCFILSCGNSTKVVSDNFLTKRKYNKGWYVNSTSNHSSETKEKYKNILERNTDTLITLMPEIENIENSNE